MANEWQRLIGRDLDVTIQDIIDARHRFYGDPEKGTGPLPFAERTLLIGNFALREHFGEDTAAYIAFETPASEANATKSFKWRGATNCLLKMVEDARESGKGFTPVAASAGNHAQGVALAMNYLGEQGVLEELGIGKAIIFMPEETPKVKMEQTAQISGGYVEIRNTPGADFMDSKKAADELVAQGGGYIAVPPYDNVEVIAGQGVVAFGIIKMLAGVAPHDNITYEDLMKKITEEGLHEKDIEFLIPNGGGGLSAGMTIAIRDMLPKAHITVVEPIYAPSATVSLMSGVTTSVKYRPTDNETGLPDASGITVGRIGDITCPILDKCRVSAATVDRNQINFTTSWLGHLTQDEIGIFPEPSGASTLAALLNKRPEEVRGKIVVPLVTGANIDKDVIKDLKDRYQHEGADMYAALRDFPVNRDLPRYDPPSVGPVR